MNKVQATEVQESIIPLVVLENTFCYWWIVAVLIVAGGLAGWLVYSFNSPIYEAKAQFSLAIDYVNAGPLTQYEEDVAVNTAGNLFMAPEVLQRVVDQAEKEGLSISLVDLQKQIFIEREFSVWNLRVRDSNPQVAEQLAKIWIRQGEALLQQSYQHAVQAHILALYIQSQEHCLEKAGAGDLLFEPCNGLHLTTIQENLQNAGTALLQERQASRQLSTRLAPGTFNAPQVSQKPVPYGRNQYIFLGSLLGAIVGIAFIELGTLKFRGMKS